MRDLVSCFNENAVNISRSFCSSYSRPPCISPNLTFSTQNSVTCLYKIILSTQKQLFVAVTWCKNTSSQGLSMNFAQSFKLNSNSVIFKQKKGSKVYEYDYAKLEVIWDLSNVKYDSGPEPKDGFYVFVLVDSEIALVLGNTAEEALKKRFLSADCSAKISLISRREEHSSGHTLYSTKAQFSDDGTKHDISIRFTEETEGSNHLGLLVRIDQKTAICVKRLQWNFRGSQTIFVDGLLVDLFWNVHDWLFRTVDGYAVFMFRTRNGEDSRSWKEEDVKNEEESVEFSLLISSNKGQIGNKQTVATSQEKLQLFGNGNYCRIVTGVMVPNVEKRLLFCIPINRENSRTKGILHSEDQNHRSIMAKESATVANISANLSSVPILNGTNFKDWKENIHIVLGCMDMDLAIRTETPITPTATSSSEERARFEKWDLSNRMSLMIIKRAIPEVFRGAVLEDTTNAKDYLAEIEKRFAKSDKAETSTILKSLISMKYKGKGNIREYIMEMSHLASKLKALKLDLHEDLLVH